MKRRRFFLIALVLSAFFAAHCAQAQAQAQDWVRWEPTAGGNGHWYKPVINTHGLDWTEAEKEARDEGGYLAVITSEAENNFVFSLVNSQDYFSGAYGSGPALGGYQNPGAKEPEGGWQWITGEHWRFTNWCISQPDNTWGIENRLQYWSGTPGVPAPTWNDLASYDRNLQSFVVERDVAPVSGFYGQAFYGGKKTNPARAVVAVHDSKGKLIKKISSNPAGQFYAHLAPGSYALVATLPGSKTVTASANVEVEIGVMTSVELDF